MRFIDLDETPEPNKPVVLWLVRLGFCSLLSCAGEKQFIFRYSALFVLVFVDNETLAV